MAHFALVNPDDSGTKIVASIHVVNNDVLMDESGDEQETLGQVFLAELWGNDPADYIQCSYNATIRGMYPYPGCVWDGENFTPPKRETM